MGFTVRIERPGQGQLDSEVEFSKPAEEWTVNDLITVAHRMRGVLPIPDKWKWLFERNEVGVVITVTCENGTRVKSSPLAVRKSVVPPEAPAQWMAGDNA